MVFSTASDEQLLAACSPRDAGDAFAEFYRRHERAVLAFHMRRVRNPEVAADLAATTFVEALAGRERFRAQRAGDAAGWLFGIAFHVFTRHLRSGDAEARRHEKLQLELHALTEDQARSIESLTEDAPLLEALATLPEAQRQAVFAHVVGDQSYEEIARSSNIGLTAARKRVSRGLAALRANAKESR